MFHMLLFALTDIFSLSYSIVPLENSERKEEVVKFKSIQYFVTLYLQSV